MYHFALKIFLPRYIRRPSFRMWTSCHHDPIKDFYSLPLSIL